ncbi:MAG: 50S ribosomal protein L10 [uncultured bacterium]|nr:MAG: 50S ribosomal protein L10 [uncultured bacterium]HBC71281.1 50S ribosomal protein L10 [Coxiellaceae bacterium]HBS52177.1 50S ribosomal protein L10 [Coxiellaceae bacterium]HBY56107.1 50S ribosomal protein L10 [Coxiellaceae bacterium]
MVLKLEDKKNIVNEVASIAAKAVSAGVADYRGLTVAEMTELRVKARKNGVYLRVVRNTLARRAVENTDFACMQDTFKGPVFLAFSQEDPGSVARLLKDAIRDYEKLTVCALALGGKLLSAKDLDVIAKLPTRDQGIAILMSVMKAPTTKLVRTMAEPYAMLVRTVAAVRDKKAA